MGKVSHDSLWRDGARSPVHRTGHFRYEFITVDPLRFLLRSLLKPAIFLGHLPCTAGVSTDARLLQRNF